MKISEQCGHSKCAFRVYKSDLELFSVSQASRPWSWGSISQCRFPWLEWASLVLCHRRPCLLLLLPEAHPALGWGKIAWITACLGVPLASSQPLGVCLWQQLWRTKTWTRTFQEHLILSVLLHFLLPLWSGNPACGIQDRFRLVAGNKCSVIFT